MSNLGEIVTCIEKEDGPWWLYCPACGHDEARLMPLPDSLKVARESTPEERRQRVAPTVTFQCELQCARCGCKAILRRCEVSVEVPGVSDA